MDFSHQRTGRVEDMQFSFAASSRTDCGTPCALKTTVAPCGTSDSSSTKMAPFARKPSHTYLLCTYFMSHIDWHEAADSALDDRDSTLDASTKAAGIREKDFHSLLLVEARMTKCLFVVVRPRRRHF